MSGQGRDTLLRGGGRAPGATPAETPDRREVLRQGGLLAAAAALGYLPGCKASGGLRADGGPPRADGAPARDGRPADAPGAAADAAGSGDAGGPFGLPTAILGKTGARVPILGLGTVVMGQGFGGWPTGKDYQRTVAVFGEAMDRGVTYIDTAAVYGRAEEAVGAALKTRQRDRVFLVTKCWADTRDGAKAQFERSLKRLGTSYVDVLHLHDLGARDIDRCLAKDGAWGYILEQKKAGRVRHVGITGHSKTAKFLRMLKTGQVEVMMVAMNFVDAHTYGFESKVLPEARKRGVGVMAMKVFGGTQAAGKNGFANYAHSERFPSQMEHTFKKARLVDAIRYIRSLQGVTGMVIGVSSAAELRETARWAATAKPFSPSELAAVQALGKTVASDWAGRFG